MSKQNIKNQQNLLTAIEMEKQGDLEGALSLLAKVTTSNPLVEQAWNRQMIVLRKLKKADQEVKTIKLAIASYQKVTEARQREWISGNKKKALATKELARSLGLLGKNDLPTIESETLNKWESRLHLLSHRMANAKARADAKKANKVRPAKTAKAKISSRTKTTSKQRASPKKA